MKIDLADVKNAIKNRETISQIAGRYNTSRYFIYKILKQENINPQELKFDHQFFETIDTEAKAYWLGFIMADGCVSTTSSPKVQIKLALKDKNHLQKWHKAICSKAKIHTIMDEAVQSSHYSKKLCEDLIRLGCTERKSLSLQFPNISTDVIHHFVRGYFDGDGSIGWKHDSETTPQMRITFVGTEQFLSSLKQRIEATSSLRPHGNTKRSRVLEIAGNKKAIALRNWMYSNASIWLDRKRAIAYA